MHPGPAKPRSSTRRMRRGSIQARSQRLFQKWRSASGHQRATIDAQRYPWPSVSPALQVHGGFQVQRDAAQGLRRFPTCAALTSAGHSLPGRDVVSHRTPQPHRRVVETRLIGAVGRSGSCPPEATRAAACNASLTVRAPRPCGILAACGDAGSPAPGRPPVSCRFRGLRAVYRPRRYHPRRFRRAGAWRRHGFLTPPLLSGGPPDSGIGARLFVDPQRRALPQHGLSRLVYAATQPPPLVRTLGTDHGSSATGRPDVADAVVTDALRLTAVQRVLHARCARHPLLALARRTDSPARSSGTASEEPDEIRGRPLSCRPRAVIVTLPRRCFRSGNRADCELPALRWLAISLAIYLAPHNYHLRSHDARPTARRGRSRYVPGRPVPWREPGTTAAGAGLFARNERVVCLCLRMLYAATMRW